MAYGSHWEWRGFGSVSSRFANYFTALEVVYSLHQVKDCYLYVPGLEANIKMRRGTENGLKFKRLNKSEIDFEIWTENEDEIFDFPLNNTAMGTLLEILQSTKLDLPSLPNEQLNRDTVIKWLKQAGVIFVAVNKERETRKWNTGGNTVLLEWSMVSKPQNIVSIGLENYSQSDHEVLTRSKHKNLLKRAIVEFELGKESLQPMNYMKAVEIWAQGNKI